MNGKGDIQNLLFNRIKEQLPQNYSLVHEISEYLKLSYDSAYRRIRGEKKLTLDETIQLCNKFRISLDDLCNFSNNVVSFTNYLVEPSNFNSNKWLDMVLYYIKQIEAGKQKEVTYASKDSPIFQYIYFPEIVSFKLFFWEKTLLQIHDSKDKTFSLAKIDASIEQKCKEISALTLRIPSTDIINEDTFRILMNQIEYCWISNYFTHEDDLLQLLDIIEKWLDHTQMQAEYGLRFLYGHEPKGLENSYRLYENKIVINDNTVTAEIDGKPMVFMTYNVAGLLISDNPEFCEGIIKFHQALKAKSTLLSQAGAQERNLFFKKLHGFVDEFRQRNNL